MRKPLALLLAAGLAASLFALPATAGGKKKKKIHESFTVQLLPFPKLTAWGDVVGRTEPGCNAGEAGVHKETVTFEAPAAGTLTAYMEGFTGDWDLHLTDADGHALYSSQNDQIQDQAAAKEELTLKMKPKDSIGITPCNWLGTPDAEIHYEFEFTGIGKKKGKGKKHAHH